MKTGIGLVKGQRKKEKAWSVAVEKGPKELRGAAIDVHGPIVVGRSPGADIVIGAEYVSSRHARFVLMGQNLFIEDMGSLNGTAVNGMHISEPTALKNGDRVCTIGGIYGTITSIKDDTIELSVGRDNVKLVFARWAIRNVEEVAIENDSEVLN